MGSRSTSALYRRNRDAQGFLAFIGKQSYLRVATEKEGSIGPDMDGRLKIARQGKKKNSNVEVKRWRMT